jgi:hypothetical protein
MEKYRAGQPTAATIQNVSPTAGRLSSVGE